MEKGVLLKRYERLMQEGEDIRNLRGFEVFSSNGELIKELKNSKENYIEAIEAKERRLNKRYSNLLAKLEELNLQEEKAFSNLLDKRIIDAEERFKKTELELKDKEEELEIEKKIPSANLTYLETEVNRIKEQKVRQEKEAQEYKTRKSKIKEIMDRIKNIEKEMENENLDPIARYSLENQRETLIEEKSKLYEPEKSTLQYTNETRNREQEMQNIKEMLGVQYRMSRNETDNLKRVLNFGQRAQKLQNQMMEYIQESLKENLEQANKNVQNRYRKDIEERTNSFITEKMKANNNLEVIKNRYEKDRITKETQYGQKIKNNNVIIEKKKTELEDTKASLAIFEQNGKASLKKGMKSRIKELSRDIENLEEDNKNKRIELKNQEKTHNENIERYENKMAEMQQQYEKYIGEVDSNMKKDLDSAYNAVSNKVLMENRDIFEMFKSLDIDYAFAEESVDLVKSFKQNANIDPNFTLETLNEFLKETSNKTITGKKEKAIIEELSKNFGLKREEEFNLPLENEEENKEEHVPIEEITDEDEPTQEEQDENVQAEEEQDENIPVEEEQDENVQAEEEQDENIPVEEEQDEAVLNEEIPIEEEPEKSTITDEENQLLQQAAYIIFEKEKASIATLQRRFKIGFNRASDIMDQLEKAGVVGEENGTKPREILMTREDFEKVKDSIFKNIKEQDDGEIGEEYAVAPENVEEEEEEELDFGPFNFSTENEETENRQEIKRNGIKSINQAIKDVEFASRLNIQDDLSLNLPINLGIANKVVGHIKEVASEFAESTVPFVAGLVNNFKHIFMQNKQITIEDKYDENGKKVRGGYLETVGNDKIEVIKEQNAKSIERTYTSDMGETVTTEFVATPYSMIAKEYGHNIRLIEDLPKKLLAQGVWETLKNSKVFLARKEVAIQKDDDISWSRTINLYESEEAFKEGKLPKFISSDGTNMVAYMLRDNKYFTVDSDNVTIIAPNVKDYIIEPSEKEIEIINRDYELDECFKKISDKIDEKIKEQSENETKKQSENENKEENKQPKFEDEPKKSWFSGIGNAWKNFTNRGNKEEEKTEEPPRQNNAENFRAAGKLNNSKFANQAHPEPGELTEKEKANLDFYISSNYSSVTGHYKGIPYHGKRETNSDMSITMPKDYIAIDTSRPFYYVEHGEQSKLDYIHVDKKEENIFIEEKRDGGGKSENLLIDNKSDFLNNLNGTYGGNLGKEIKKALHRTLGKKLNEKELLRIAKQINMDENEEFIINWYENQQAFINGDKPIIISKVKRYSEEQKKKGKEDETYVNVLDSDREQYIDFGEKERKLKHKIQKLSELGQFIQIPSEIIEIIKRGYEPEHWMTEICNAIKAKEEQQKQKQNQSEQGSN